MRKVRTPQGSAVANGDHWKCELSSETGQQKAFLLKRLRLTARALRVRLKRSDNQPTSFAVTQSSATLARCKTKQKTKNAKAKDAARTVFGLVAAILGNRNRHATGNRCGREMTVGAGEASQNPAYSRVQTKVRSRNAEVRNDFCIATFVFLIIRSACDKRLRLVD